MNTDTRKHILANAKKTLEVNDLGGWTRPTEGLYPHQWFWDSCFIAIGWSHLNIDRAQQELRSMISGQWQNGMIPHIIFSDNQEYHAGPDLWKSHRHPAAPKGRPTTAITQPPMLAEAIVRIADRLSAKQRKVWLEEMFKPLVDYHVWLYSERDPYDEGLVFLAHSWESGLDNNPPWMDLMVGSEPLKVKFSDVLHLEDWMERRRKDTTQVPAAERIRTKELYTVYHMIKRMRGMDYDQAKILDSTIPLYTDVVFNSILIRANQILASIATELGKELPVKLNTSIEKAPAALQTLRTSTGEFFGRDFRTKTFVMEPSIATFLPLYSGGITQEQADELAGMMQTDDYWMAAGVASAPKSSKYFAPRRYWQGPVWVNTNWLLIDGLRRYGHNELADRLAKVTLDLVATNGMYEYFSPIDGSGAGSSPFSWTAALAIDLLNTKQ